MELSKPQLLIFPERFRILVKVDIQHRKDGSTLKHELELHHLGPVDSCHLKIDKFTVLTGPQANGKSTVAKAIYFFRTVKQDILNIIMQGGPQAVSGRDSVTWQYVMTQRMKDKFLQLFGTSWIMPDDMEMRYTYKRNVFIRVFLKENQDDPSKNFIKIEFSDDILNLFEELQQHSFSSITNGQVVHEETELNRFFDDPFETIFIPAGRNLITLLSAQLNYIFTSLESSQLRNIDYITKKYTELILKVKPMFSHGIDGIINEAKNDPIRERKYYKNRPSITLLLEAASKVLGGNYYYTDNEERLYLMDGKYVKINLASSGQQEVIWVFNLLFYYLIEDKRVFLILEEPESHLYPSSQEIMAQALSLILDSGNSVLVTTHSPYILGTFNYLLLADQVPSAKQDEIKRKLRKRLWLSSSNTNAYYIHKGTIDSAMTDESEGLRLIQNELIDGASSSINEMTDFLLDSFDCEEESE